MSGLIESATAILSASERRLEMVSNNVANVSTPGFKRQISFSDLMPGTLRRSSETTFAAGGAGGASAERAMAAMFLGEVGAASSAGAFAPPQLRARADLSQGKMSETKNPLDLAISGAGFFQLRAGDDIVYSRQGQFRLAENGTVVTPQGHVLQQAGGGDLILDRAAVKILEDGTVLDEDKPVARIALFAWQDGSAGESAVHATGGSLFTFSGEAVEVAAPVLRQGLVEASNVSMGDEMVTMMAAVRQAESGARLVQLYDDLMGRAITAFGQSGQ